MKIKYKKQIKAPKNQSISILSESIVKNQSLHKNNLK